MPYIHWQKTQLNPLDLRLTNIDSHKNARTDAHRHCSTRRESRTASRRFSGSNCGIHSAHAWLAPAPTFAVDSSKSVVLARPTRDPGGMSCRRRSRASSARVSARASWCPHLDGGRTWRIHSSACPSVGRFAPCSCVWRDAARSSRRQPHLVAAGDLVPHYTTCTGLCSSLTWTS